MDGSAQSVAISMGGQSGFQGFGGVFVFLWTSLLFLFCFSACASGGGVEEGGEKKGNTETVIEASAVFVSLLRFFVRFTFGFLWGWRRGRMRRRRRRQEEEEEEEAEAEQKENTLC
jgi:bacteriorhodopsin